MISSRSKNLLWASVLASATFASGAFAQQAPVTAPVPPAAEAQVDGKAQAAPRKHTRADRADRAKRVERMQEMRAKRQAALKDKLQLTPEQEPAWNSFVEASKPAARTAEAQPRPDRAEFRKLTTPERLDRMQARQAARTAMFAQRADATRSFYAALNPEQQKTFDAESVRRIGHGKHRHHGHPHRSHGQPEAPAKS